MSEIFEYQYIASLITKERLGTLSDSERQELDAWLLKDVGCQLIYKRLKERDFTEDVKRCTEIDLQTGLNKYKQFHLIRRKRIIYRWMSVAAVFIVLFTTGVILFQNESQEPVVVENILPGTSKAQLILADGKTRHLENIQIPEEIDIDGKIVCNTGSQISYTDNKTSGVRGGELIYNQLQIPKGGEYQLVLSDGTKVWLNSQSSLRFPIEFNERERRVYLEGEAYFEVTHDVNRPFYVQARGEVDICVLGTSFNVKAYADENVIETVLTTGSVKMLNRDSEVVLSPGQRGKYRMGEKKMEVDHVDTELYVSWKDGQLLFENQRIEDIMKQLARWYDMEIFYQNEEAKDILFSGDVKRYEIINTLLESLEISGGVHFKIKGRTVIVGCR